MTDPEALYAQLTSGDSGRVRQLGTDLQVAAHDIDEAAERLTQGLSRPVWDSVIGRLAFLVQGQTAFVKAATASWRLDRGSEAMALAADGYDAMAGQADQVITTWRQRPPALLPFQEDLLRFVVNTHLVLLAAQYGAVLSQAQGLLADAEEDLQDWFDDGTLQDYWFAVRTGAGRGPRLPDSLLNGDLSGFTVQGLAYDGASGTYLISSYAHGENGDDSQLTVLDGPTGSELTSVQLTSPSGSGQVSPPQHSGGVAVDGDNVYVVSSEGGSSYLYQYSLSEIRGADAGSPVPALTVSEVPASSYVSTANGNLYLGAWNDDGPGQLYSYPLSSVGSLIDDRDFGSPTPISTPPGVNGVVPLPDGGYVYAQNNTRDAESQLITVGPNGQILNQMAVGNLIEEIELVDGQIVGVSESGSVLYSPFDDGTDDPGDLWGQTNMFELPLGLVTGELVVEPQTLREAAAEFDAAVDGLQATGGRVRSLHLSGSWLGDVPQASGLASATSGYLAETASAVEEGVTASDATAAGLRTAAKEYGDADSAAGDVLGALRGVLGY